VYGIQSHQIIYLHRSLLQQNAVQLLVHGHSQQCRNPRSHIVKTVDHTCLDSGATFFMSFMSDGVRLYLWIAVTSVLLFIPHMIHEYGEPRWNGTDSEKPNISEKNLFQCHIAFHKSHMDWPGRKTQFSVLRARRLNQLSHGTALVLLNIMSSW
jgi:hypothetical protein